MTASPTAKSPASPIAQPRALSPFAGRVDHRTPAQRAADQSKVDSLGFPRGLRTF